MADYETAYMYVGYNDPNNVSHFRDDAVTQLNEKKLRCFTGTAHHSRDAATGFAAVATRCAQAAGVWKTVASIKWPYQPKHSPSFSFRCKMARG